jgi:pimeloyl-ACP methyl ester carboxylesterase
MGWSFGAAILLLNAQTVGAGLPLEGAMSHYVENDGVKLHYVSKGDGPLLVFVHGFPDFWLSWKGQIEALSGEYRCVAVDTRGYNLSDQPAAPEAYDMALLVSDVVAVIKDCGEAKATIVGHDWGGAIAWQFAMNVPEMTERLVILNLPHPKGLMRELARNPKQQEASAYARAFQRPDSHKTLTPEILVSIVNPKVAEDRAAYFEAFRQSSMEAMMQYYRRNYPREPYRETPGVPPKVQCSVLQFHGLDDRALLPAALNGTWEWVAKDWTLVTVPGAGHWVHHDASELVNKTLLDWLKRHLVPSE